MPVKRLLIFLIVCVGGLATAQTSFVGLSLGLPLLSLEGGVLWQNNSTVTTARLSGYIFPMFGQFGGFSASLAAQSTIGILLEPQGSNLYAGLGLRFHYFRDVISNYFISPEVLVGAQLYLNPHWAVQVELGWIISAGWPIIGLGFQYHFR